MLTYVAELGSELSICQLPPKCPMHRGPGSLFASGVNIPAFVPCFIGRTYKETHLPSWAAVGDGSSVQMALFLEQVWFLLSLYHKHITQEPTPHQQLFPLGIVRYVALNICLLEKQVMLYFSDLSSQQAYTHSLLTSCKFLSNYFTLSFVFPFWKY